MIDIISYMNSVYNWDVSQAETINTRYATNANYRIKYNGFLYFVKLYASKNAYATERWFLTSLSQTGCTSKVILSFDGDENNRASVILPYFSTFQALDTETIKKSDGIAFNIGKELRKVHTGMQSAEHFGKIHKSEQFQFWKDYLKSRLLQIKTLYEKYNLSIIEKVYNKIETSFSDIPNDISPNVVHSDLNPDNILFDPISKKIIFIDFERSFFGHFEMDFPKLFWRCFNFDESLIRSFYDGYGTEPNRKCFEVYQNIFFIDLLSYLINISAPSNEDTKTIREILGILENGTHI